MGPYDRRYKCTIMSRTPANLINILEMDPTEFKTQLPPPFHQPTYFEISEK